MRRGFGALFFVLLAVSSAGAKDYRSMPAADVGGRWVFAYRESAREIRVNPALAYGGTFTQIVDFEWARNMAFEVNFLHSVSHGEATTLDTGAVEVFDLTWDSGAFNIGYFFSGRKLLPYMSTGLGVVSLKYEPELAKNKIWEQNFYFNIGGGADWTVWETKSGGSLDRILLGARVRYEYTQVTEIVDVALNALAITGRFELRF